MKKLLALVLALCMLLSLCACGGETASEPRPAPAETEAPAEETAQPENEASVAAGTYKYYEDKGTMGIMPWTIELGEDGSCVLTEHNKVIGDQVKPCDGWVDNGDGTFTSGAWESTDGPKPDFIDEVGRITWQVVSEGICQPINGPESVDPETAGVTEEEVSEDEAEEEVVLDIVTPENYVSDPSVAVIATDRHDNVTILPQLLSMIYSEGYSPAFVAHGGDAVGSKGNFAPETDTSVIRAEIDLALSPDVDLLVLMAAHDENMTDSIGALYTECVAVEYDDYYVYALPQDYMDTEELAVTASAEFVEWANGSDVDPSKPIIVLSHMPIHYKRQDNVGAASWHDAINQVATAGGDEAVRNVFFFHGHNHTADPTEYYYAPGSTIAIQGLGEDGQGEDIIHYTYITAGYLNENGDCTVLKVEDTRIRVLKFSLESVTELGVLDRLG